MTIAKAASTAVAMAVISPDRSTDMAEAYAVHRRRMAPAVSVGCRVHQSADVE